MERLDMATIRETSRLVLREFVTTDVDALAGIFADPAMMYFGPGVRSLAETAAWIESMRAGYRVRGRGLWAVVVKPDDVPIGVCGLIPQVVLGLDRVEIGYRVAREYWGRGIASEAARAARDVAFEQFDLDEVISIIEPGNRGSIRVAEKNGMTLERVTELWNRPVRIYRVRRTRCPASTPPVGPVSGASSTP